MRAVERGERGFSVIELLVALVVLSIGLLAMASVMGSLVIQTRAADIRTERSFAVQQAVERLKARNLSLVEDLPQDSAQRIGSYPVWWNVTGATGQRREVEIYTLGPGYEAGAGFNSTAVDTFPITLARMD